MKILHIIGSANLAHGGPVEFAARAGVMLSARGHRQDLMTLDSPDASFLDVPFGGAIYALGSAERRVATPLARLEKRFAITPEAIKWLRTHISDYEIAIVSGLWNYATLAARRVLVGGNVPFVVFTHGMLDPWFNRRYPLKGIVKQLLWPFNEGALLQHASRVLFTCEEERLLARASFKPYRAREYVVGFGSADVEGDGAAQAAHFRSTIPGLGNRRFLLFMSRIHEKKGCDLLVEAFGRLSDVAPDIDLVIAGPDQQGLQATLAARAATLGVSERVHWPGMISGDTKWGALRSCEAFVLPSHQENFGVVLAEAMACGRPILTTNKVNIWREIEADGAGIVVNDDVDGVAAGLGRLYDMTSAARETMGNRARCSFASRYKMDRFVDDLEGVLQACCDEGGPG